MPAGPNCNFVEGLPHKVTAIAWTPDKQGIYAAGDQKIVYADISNVTCTESTCSGAVLTDIFGMGGNTGPAGFCPVAATSRGAPRNFMDVAVAPDGSLYFSIAGPMTFTDYLCVMRTDGSVEELRVGSGMSFLQHDGQKLFMMGGSRHTATNDPPTLRYLDDNRDAVLHAFSIAGSAISPAAAKIPRIGRTTGNDSTIVGFWAMPNGLLQYVATANDIWTVKPSMPTLGDALVIPSANGKERFLFAATGQHLETRNAHTGALLRSFEYDTQQFLIAMKRHDPTGVAVETITIQRDSAGKPTELLVDIDGDGPGNARVHELDFNANGALLSLEDPAQQRHEFGYTSDNIRLMTSFADPAGRSKNYSFDNKTRITTQTDPVTAGQSAAGAFSFDYQASTSTEPRASLRTTPSGLTTRYGYQVSTEGEVQQANLFPDSSQSTSSRDALRVTTTVGRDGTQTTVTSQPDPTALPQEYVSNQVITLPGSGISMTRTRSKTGTPISDGWLSEMSETECIASTQGNLCTTVDYDATTGTRTTQTPEGRVTTEYLDELERINELLPPGSPRVRTVYDGDKVTAIIIDPDGVANNGDERKTQMEYDPSTGLLAKVIDPLTKETLFGNYDLADRPGTITLPDAAQVLMSYDAEGNVASVTPPGKSPHGMSYGPKGRIESYTPPVGNSVQFFYVLISKLGSQSIFKLWS